eukprot:jgi/Mesvir1/14091/Mv21387-RA.1
MISLHTGTAIDGTSTVFYQNVATLNGGALVLSSGARATLTSATFLANRAVRSGGSVLAGQDAVFYTVETTFENNTAGERGAGIVATLGANVTLILAHASSNAATGFGGLVMAKDGGTNVFVEGGEFSRNSGDWGATFYFEFGVRATIRNAVFAGNRAQVVGGVMHAIGVGTQVSLSGCSFLDNFAGGVAGALMAFPGSQVAMRDVLCKGGWVSNFGGCVQVLGATFTVTNLTCVGNYAGTGGGCLYFFRSGPSLVEDALFFNNTSGRFGGGIYGKEAGLLVVRNARFVDNQAGVSGGAISLLDAGAVSVANVVVSRSNAFKGGAVSVKGELTLTNGSFVDNHAVEYGGFLEVTGGGQVNLTYVTVVRSTAGLGGGGMHVTGAGSTVEVANETTFSGCMASDGAGVLLSAVNGSSSMLLGAVELTQNYAPFGGGACALGNGSILLMEAQASAGSGGFLEAVVEGNSALLDGGGILLGYGAVGSLFKGSCVHNTAGRDGGGVSAPQAAELLSVQGISAPASLPSVQLTMNGSSLHGNTAQRDGGAVFMAARAKGMLEGCTVAGNTARSQGGAVLARDRDTLLSVQAGMVLDNLAGLRGGGLCLLAGARVYLQRASIENNTAAAHGGALAMDTGSQLQGENCLLRANVASQNGGGLFVKGDGTSAWLRNGMLDANRGEHGGAAYITEGGRILIDGGLLRDNAAGSGWGHAVLAVGRGCQFMGSNCSLEARGAQVPLEAPGLVLVSKDADMCVVTASSYSAASAGVDPQQGWLAMDGKSWLEQQQEQMMNVAGEAAPTLYNCSETAGGEVEVADFPNLQRAVLEDRFNGILRLTADITMDAPVVIDRNLQLIGACRQAGDGNSNGSSTPTATRPCHLRPKSSSSLFSMVDGGNVLLQNLVLLGGQAATGGALQVLPGGALICDSVSFQNNSALKGGAVFVTGAHASFISCAFEGNDASQQGGAVYAEEAASVIITGSVATANSAPAGGFLYATGANTDVASQSSFYSNNIATQAGGAFFVAASAHTSIQGGKIAGNYVNSADSNMLAGRGGAVFIAGQGTVVTLEGECLLDGNRAGSGGAVYAEAGSLLVANVAGELGGAFYGADGGTHLVLLNTHLEQSHAGVRGAGLYLTSAATANVSWCTFFNGSAPDGGALALEGAGACVTCTDSSFHRSHAVLLGGVAFLTAGASCSFLRVNFSENGVGNAGRGGVGFAQNLETSVMSQGCNYIGNVASGGGGGWFLLGGPAMTSEGDIFEGNLADKGGAIAALEFDTQFHAKGSMFAHNHAKGDGGAIYFSSVGACSLVSCALLQNVAKGQGGAVYWGGGSIMGRSVANHYLGNMARCGGALALVSESAVDASMGDVFADNWAEFHGGAVYVVEGSTAPFQSWVPESSPPLAGSRPLASSCTFERNQALFGGGIYVDCAMEGSFGSWRVPVSACVSLHSCVFVENVAVGGCGGGVWSNIQTAVNITCADAGTNKNVSTNQGETAMGCASWTGNAAINSGYGPQVCTPGTSLFLLPPGADLGAPLPAASTNRTLQIVGHRSGAELSGVIVVLADMYRQVASTEKGLLLSTQIIAASVDFINSTVADNPDDLVGGTSVGMISMPSLSGRLVHTFVNGIAHVNDIYLTAPPGRYVVGFYSTGYESRARVEVATRACLPGEVHVAGACERCLAPLFSWDPDNETCDVCPPNAECYGGHLVVPLAGYWQPTRASYRMHRCLRAEACTFGGRAKAIADALTGNGTWDPDVQCSQGYRGTLCAECEEGYTWSSGYYCTPCPPDEHRIAVYVIVTAASAVVVAVVVNVALTLARFPSAKEANGYMLGTLVKISVIWLHLLGMMCQVGTTRLTPLTKFIQVLADVSAGPGTRRSRWNAC